MNKNLTLSGIDKFKDKNCQCHSRFIIIRVQLWCSTGIVTTFWTDSTDDFHPLDELLKLPCCSGDKVAQLHAVYDKISVNVRGLEAIGVKADRYGSFLILIIMGNLPADVRLQIARVTTRKVWDVEKVLQIVK